MIDLTTQMKIDALLDYAYDRTIERMNGIETAPPSNIYQSLVAHKESLESHVFAYLNYYCGCLEGIFFTRFLEELNRMPTPSENVFIKESITTRFKELKKLCLELGDKKFKENNE